MMPNPPIIFLPGFSRPFGLHMYVLGGRIKLINTEECNSVMFTVLKSEKWFMLKTVWKTSFSTWFHLTYLPIYLYININQWENVHFTLEVESYCCYHTEAGAGNHTPAVNEVLNMHLITEPTFLLWCFPGTIIWSSNYHDLILVWVISRCIRVLCVRCCARH